ncbi:MAG: alkaline phosphatase family protein [Candidatus Cybelea sp.]
MKGSDFGRRALSICVALVLSVAVAGCHSAGSGSPQVVPFAKAPGLQSRILNLGRPIEKIKHIVIIVQMGRSFNDLFMGFPGAKTATYGYDSKNKKIVLQPIGFARKWDLEHNAQGFIAACNGTGKIPGTDCRMNGFDNETWTCRQVGQPKCPIEFPPYSYVPHSETKPYFSMAHQYVLADEMYPSDFDASEFISLQYIIAGVNPDSSTGYPDEIPWGCPGGPTDRIYTLGAGRRISARTVVPCWGPDTLGKELDANGISWAYYASRVKGINGRANCGGKPDADYANERSGIWSAYQAIKYICYGADWNKDVISPPGRFSTDVKNGEFRSVTWVTPTYRNSDYGGNDSGPSWVASIVNVIGESKFWDSSAIFIFWSDYGGWYDPEPPQYVDNDGLGIRVPLLIISPYAKDGYVSHVHYEHGSILKFIEDRFRLARLAASDRRANSPETDSFDFTQPPRKFVPIKAP